MSRMSLQPSYVTAWAQVFGALSAPSRTTAANVMGLILEFIKTPHNFHDLAAISNLRQRTSRSSALRLRKGDDPFALGPNDATTCHSSLKVTNDTPAVKDRP